MNFEKLEKFIKLAKEMEVSSLKYESKDEKYSVSIGQQMASFAPALVTSNMAAPSNRGPEGENSAAHSATGKQSGLIEVTSPFVGTFYTSASPAADAYVRLGDKVSNGQVLCIVEAMKIMNEIESEVSGEIIEICAENENYVEFGQVLYRIRP